MSHQSDLIATNIDAYLAQHEQKELLRFLTCGSVDDGKSTLIGHLLHLVNALKRDQLDQVKSLGKVDQSLNYAFFTDGLKSERELGITIDVSYKYFSTPKRRFIIADCPGHQEYMRNMFTGASTADLVVLMVNVENGITEQTRRHLQISQLLNIPNIVFCINKMDLVGYNEEAFNILKMRLSTLANTSNSHQLFIPVSATLGDNLVKSSDNMPWYKGETLLETLNMCNKSKVKDAEACFPVQLSIDKHNQCQLF
jgi:sulfate adenylyltransferase subunit 1